MANEETDTAVEMTEAEMSDQSEEELAQEQQQGGPSQDAVQRLVNITDYMEPEAIDTIGSELLEEVKIDINSRKG